jgi:TonB family protein
MFSQVHSGLSKRQTTLLGISLTLHFAFLGWILHSPTPIFVAPISVVQGQSGSSLTRIYFGGQSGISLEHPNPRLTFQRPPKVAKAHRMEPPDAKLEAGNITMANRPGGPAAGSLYGSLSVGTFIGPEIRPALPVVSPDPFFGSDAATLQGDVIVEITIDEQGNIVQKIVLQSVNPAVDERILAALEKWHFIPASKNGSPIPSKQDVYYHFPR